MTIKFYYSSVSSDRELKAKQQKIENILSSKHYEYEMIDIAASEDAKKEMRAIAGPGTIPPQICNGDRYCGDYDAFELAVENETLDDFLKLTPIQN